MQRPIRALSTPPRELKPLPLRQHRLRARVSLDEIIDRTKISRRFLEAIEDGDYKQLPGGVFSVSYIRQYAAAIGFDAEEILEHYRGSQQSDDGIDERARQTPQTQSIVRLARFLMLS